MSSATDKRKFSGNRVLAECEIILKSDNPFAHFGNVKNGYVVLNVRGGCLYFPERFSENEIVKIFQDGKVAVFEKITLSAGNRPKIIIEDVKVAFLRLRKGKNREGIVFRFIDISEQQLDTLYSLLHKLPVIGANEECSVPFDEVILLGRGRDFEIL
jgi:hypothetical protein